MAKKYLLDCPCGVRIPVEARQAGEEVHCGCGGRLEVPTLRRLQQLDEVELAELPANWTRGQGTLFVLGLVCLLVGSLVTAWFYSATPSATLFPTFRYSQRIAPDSLTIQYQRTPALVYAMADDLDRRRDRLTPAESLRLWGVYRDVPLVMQQLPALRRQNRKSYRFYRYGTYIAAGMTLVLSSFCLGGALWGRKAVAHS